MEVTGLNDQLDFGKYSGLTLRQVIDNDFAWVEWAVNNNVLFLDLEAEDYYANAFHNN